ncbi:MAG: DUF4340 domain-containing protein [Phycisphaerae bacterium]|nr:DUF4340 domain-containing protein [Phycisphaerae bacterium]
MNQRSTYLILVAVLLAAVAVWALRPAPPAVKPDELRPGAPRPLIDPAPGEITAMEIAPQGRPAIAFAKADGKWTITAPIQAPGSAATIESAVSRLRDLKYVSEIGANDADRPGNELTGLDQPVRVKLTDAAGKAYVLRVGGSVPAARQTYVQKEEGPTIYVVDTDLRRELEKPLNDYRDRRVADLVTTEAVAVEVSGEQRYRLKLDKDQWKFDEPASGRADKQAVENLLRELSTLSITTFVDDQPKNMAIYGLDRPSATVTVHCEKKVPKPAPATQTTQPVAPEIETKPYTVSVVFGAKTGDKRFGRMAESDRPWVFQVPDASVARIVPELLTLRDKRIVSGDATRADRVQMSGVGGEYALVRKGAAWEISSPALAKLGSNVAELAAVDDLLKAVRDLKATGFESSDDPLRDFGFSPPRARISVTVDGAKTELVVGKETPSATGTYVRNEGEGFVAVVKKEDLAALLVGPLNFANRDMLRFDRGRASVVELQRDSGRVKLTSAAGQWTCAEPLKRSADASAIGNLLTDLCTLRARRIVGSADQLAEFGLDRAAVVASITVDPPPPPPKPAPTTQPTTAPATQPVVEEPPPPTGKPEHYAIRAARKDDKVYVHVEGSQTIGEVDARVFDNLSAELLDRRVVPMEQTQVTALSLTRGSGAPFTFEKSGEQWKLVGETTFPCDASKINEVVGAMCALRLDRFVHYQPTDLKRFGLDQPVLRVKVRGESGEHELLIAAAGPPEDSTGKRYAALAGSGSVFLISKDDAAKFDQEIQAFQRPS